MKLSNLQPTYGNFKVRGIVSGINTEFSYKSDVGKSGKPYKSLRFNVKTSETNQVPVELSGSVMDNVLVMNDAKSKAYVPWKERYDGRDGFKPLGVTIGIKKDETGKNLQENMVAFDAAEYLHEELQDGDSVMIMGRITWNTYTKNNETVTNPRYEIQRVYKSSDEVDFTAENFKEVAEFKQEIVIVDSNHDKETNKLTINTYIVTDKDGNFVSYPFTVDVGDESLKTLGRNLMKQKFGTTIVVEGKILNGVVVVEAPEQEEDFGWGLPSEFERRVIKETIKELRITRGNPASLQEKRYKEDEFIKEDEDLPF